MRIIHLYSTKRSKSTRIPVASARGGADHLFLLGAVVGVEFIALNNASELGKMVNHFP